MDQEVEISPGNTSEVSPKFLHVFEDSSLRTDLLFQNDTNSTNSSDDYEYDIDQIGPLEEFIPVVLAYGITLVLGVTGNLLVIFAITRYKRMQSVTNIFLISLSTADLLLVLICVPVKVSDKYVSVLSLRQYLARWSNNHRQKCCSYSPGHPYNGQHWIATLHTRYSFHVRGLIKLSACICKLCIGLWHNPEWLIIIFIIKMCRV